MAETAVTQIDAAILANALGPKSASGDAGSMEQHSIQDLIEARRLLSSVSTSSSSRKLPIRITRIVPGGTI